MRASARLRGVSWTPIVTEPERASGGAMKVAYFLSLAALLTTAIAAPAAVACNLSDRPGIPANPSMRLKKGGLQLLWENRSRIEPLYYDIDVFQEGISQPVFVRSGVRDNPVTAPVHTWISNAGYFCSGPNDQQYDPVANAVVWVTCSPITIMRDVYAGYGQFAAFMLPPMALNKKFCFRVRARSEGGKKGCVSKAWSPLACGSTFFVPIWPLNK